MPAVSLLVACHDAGGAEIVSSWLRRRPDADAVPCLLEGPARAIFARKLGPALRTVDALPSLDGLDLVLCGSSADAPLERGVVRAARAAGVRSAVWLDHWVNYPQRFVLDGAAVLPDEVWVADEHAERLAAETLPGARIRLCGNPYLEDAAAEIHSLEQTRGRGGERILYLTQPTTVAAQLATGDPLGMGLRGARGAARLPGAACRSAAGGRAHPAAPGRDGGEVRRRARGVRRPIGGRAQRRRIARRGLRMGRHRRRLRHDGDGRRAGRRPARGVGDPAGRRAALAPVRGDRALVR